MYQLNIQNIKDPILSFYIWSNLSSEMILILRLLWKLPYCSQLFIISIECKIPQRLFVVGGCQGYLVFSLNLQIMRLCRILHKKDSFSLINYHIFSHLKWLLNLRRDNHLKSWWKYRKTLSLISLGVKPTRKIFCETFLSNISHKLDPIPA